MTYIETTHKGRVYQSKDFEECYNFMEFFGGKLSTDYYEDWLKEIYTVII